MRVLVKRRERCCLMVGRGRGAPGVPFTKIGGLWDACPVPSVAAVAAPSVARHAIDAAPARRVAV